MSSSVILPPFAYQNVRTLWVLNSDVSQVKEPPFTYQTKDVAWVLNMPTVDSSFLQRIVDLETKTASLESQNTLWFEDPITGNESKTLPTFYSREINLNNYLDLVSTNLGFNINWPLERQANTHRMSAFTVSIQYMGSGATPRLYYNPWFTVGNYYNVLNDDGSIHHHNFHPDFSWNYSDRAYPLTYNSGSFRSVSLESVTSRRFNSRFVPGESLGDPSSNVYVDPDSSFQACFRRYYMEHVMKIRNGYGSYYPGTFRYRDIYYRPTAPGSTRYYVSTVQIDIRDAFPTTGQFVMFITTKGFSCRVDPGTKFASGYRLTWQIWINNSAVSLIVAPTNNAWGNYWDTSNNSALPDITSVSPYNNLNFGYYQMPGFVNRGECDWSITILNATNYE